jgi:hypothetical protein
VDDGDSDAGGDYGTPIWDDYAIVKVQAGAEMPELQRHGLFDESWRLPRQAGRLSILELRGASMVLTASASLKDEIKSAVLKVEKDFSPQVVRIVHSFEEDSLGAPAVYFRILVRDEDAPIAILGVLAQRISLALMNDARTHENGLHAYFNYRTVSEQQKLQDPAWN